MSIFKKSIKHSKSSHLNEKIEMLNNELNKTGLKITEDDRIVVSNQKEDKGEDLDKVDWRKDLLQEENIDNVNLIDEEIDLIREDLKIKNNSLKRVDSHIKNIDKDFLNLRQEIFQEISENFLFNIPSIEQKIDKVLKIYDTIEESLLNEPPSTKNSDPLTPLDQNFVTVDELNNHYKLFINRIQEQIATVGGGGEYRFQYLDGIVGIVTNSSAYNGKYLQWNSATNKAEFVAVSSGNSGIATYASTAGIATYASTAGIATYATKAGIATNVIGGIASVTSLSVSGITTLGVVTAVTSINFSNGGLLGDPYGDGGTGLKASATGAQYAIVASNNLQQFIQVDDNQIFIGTGYASTTGSYNWQFDKNGVLAFPDNTLQSTAFTGYASTAGVSTIAGYATTAGISTVAQGLTGSPNITVGIVTASSFSGSGINLTGIVTSIVAGTNVTVSGSTGQVTINATGGGGTNYWSQTAAGINTLSNVGIGTTNPTSKLQVVGDVLISGIVTASSFRGDGSQLTGVIASNSGIVVKNGGSLIGTASTIDFSTNLSVSPVSAGVVTVTASGGSSGYASTAGISTVAQNLTGSPNITVSSVNSSGVVTASSFSGSGINLTGIVTSIVAGTNVTVSGSTGQVTINATGVGSGSNYWSQTAAGINTLSNVGIGTTNPTTTLSVSGNFTATDTRIQSVAEKTTLVNLNTANLVYNTGGGNIAICTNPSGDITLNVTAIPTDSTFNNYSLAFSVIVTNSGIARSCTAINLNGVSRTIKWFGGSLSAAISGVTTSNGYDVYSFTGINTVGSASTTANYIVLGSVNGSYR